MTSENRSPWIHQLNHERETITLSGDIDADVVIVGAGIAGIATAFFLLRDTNRSVVILEGGRLAHGATGHNAGQITSYFERPFYELAEEFGLELAAQGQQAIEQAWNLLDEMYREAGLDMPLARFIGHAGLMTKEQTFGHLRNTLLRSQAGISTEELLIARDARFANSIPPEYAGLYRLVERTEILQRLETDDHRFLASLSAPKGCMNSALFCQEVVAYLRKHYGKRFSLYEHTFVKKIIFHDDFAVLDAVTHTVEARRVVLCTNGFENLTLIDRNGLKLDTSFHHTVSGFIGFMAGYLDFSKKLPTALSYIMERSSLTDDTSTDPYFYLTRRSYDFEKHDAANLISVGGPVMSLEDQSKYRPDMPYPKAIEREIDEFVRTVCVGNSDPDSEYLFRWHGLMGYTKSGVRLIGEDPSNRTLLYNLGCNGVGILPSLHGGKVIARLLKGEDLPPSLFDPLRIS